MPSPFPGMDPYLEARWSTFHASMVGAIMAGLNGVLPDDLEASTDEEVRIEPLAGEEVRGYRPGVAVVDLGPTAASDHGLQAVTTAVEDEMTIRTSGPR